MSVKDIPLARYEMAVWDNPIKPGESRAIWLVRIAELVAGHLPPPLKDMPEVRLPYKDSE